MRFFRPVLAAAAVAGCALALAAPTGAAATAKAGTAKGWFAWVGPKGAPFFIENPPDGRCLTMSQESQGAHNATALPATVYPQKECKGTPLRLAPGSHAPRNASFASVKFGSH
ncbi:hypothetical protein [Streptomyces roseoverticillatus]|uniref:hypothetical protein n=1 Tax=Streptomyces roseoverticillatus TaxID=66429 RepID=UPI0006937679|nr:hypothetical protein [Streptomyces roseoverticillatus]